jgi:hypothetical protein
MRADIFVFVAFRQYQQKPLAYLNRAAAFGTRQQARFHPLECGSSLLRHDHHKLIIDRQSAKFPEIRNTRPRLADNPGR